MLDGIWACPSYSSLGTAASRQTIKNKRSDQCIPCNPSHKYHHTCLGIWDVIEMHSSLLWTTFVNRYAEQSQLHVDGQPWVKNSGRARRRSLRGPRQVDAGRFSLQEITAGVYIFNRKVAIASYWACLTATWDLFCRRQCGPEVSEIQHVEVL